MRPLFCKIINPLALKWYVPVSRHLFALGRDASPQQVIGALQADYQAGGTGPITCASYTIWAYRWHWRFGVDPVEAVTGVPCL